MPPTTSPTTSSIGATSLLATHFCPRTMPPAKSSTLNLVHISIMTSSLYPRVVPPTNSSTLVIVDASLVGTLLHPHTVPPANTSPTWALLGHPSWLHVFTGASCLLQTPPRTSLLVHPARLHIYFTTLTPCLPQTPPPLNYVGATRVATSFFCCISSLVHRALYTLLPEQPGWRILCGCIVFFLCACGNASSSLFNQSLTTFAHCLYLNKRAVPEAV